MRVFSILTMKNLNRIPLIYILYAILSIEVWNGENGGDGVTRNVYGNVWDHTTLISSACWNMGRKGNKILITSA